MKTRPPFLKNWREIESRRPQPRRKSGWAADFADATGLSRLKILHLRLPPGTRSNIPGAYRDEEEFFFVLEGAPDLWVDGHLHRAARRRRRGASTTGTGIAHTLINNTDRDVRLFVLGEATRMRSQFFMPLDADEQTQRRPQEAWASCGLIHRSASSAPTAAKRRRRRGRKRGRPAYVARWLDILGNDEGGYPGSTEKHGIDSLYGRRARFSRLGIHFEVLPAGRRTSWPHAERDEEEFLYVVSGQLDCWLDGHIHPMGEGDFVGWEAGTGITHVVINNSDEDAVLLVGGEASRQRNQFWYPFHPHRDKETGEDFWHDHPKPKFGPHDGLPDALRARLPKAARRRTRSRQPRGDEAEGIAAEDVKMWEAVK